MAETGIVTAVSLAGSFIFLAIICGIARARRSGKPKMPLEVQEA